MPITGVDSSSACTDTSIACLKAGGYSFVGRYYSRTTHIAGKKLTKAEAELIAKSGLILVTVYEDGPTQASYFSAARGTQDAEAALAQAAAIGQPRDSAIYFTVDYDAAHGDITGGITEYFKAIAATINNAYAVGVYGSGAVCTAIKGGGLATYAWLAQSTGWTGFHEYAGWNIRQGAEQSVCGLNSDLDEAQGEYGGFTLTLE
ncbi:MAG TPA: glycoside hydrolase domain-containing protein [Thermoanaerobaculia bacterium]